MVGPGLQVIGRGVVFASQALCFELGLGVKQTTEKKHGVHLLLKAFCTDYLNVRFCCWVLRICTGSSWVPG